MPDEKGYADESLELKVLAIYLRVDNTLSLALDYFTLEEARNVFKFVIDNRFSFSSLIDEFWDLFKFEVKKKGWSVDRYLKFIQKLWGENIDYTSEQIASLVFNLEVYIKARGMFKILEDSVTHLKDMEPEKGLRVIEDGIADVRSSFPSKGITRSDFVETFFDRYKKYRNPSKYKDFVKIPTGIAKLDKRIGGVASSSFNFIQGTSGVGKTYLLMELGYQGFLRHERVLFVTVELMGQVIELRWDSRISGVLSDDLPKIDGGDSKKLRGKMKILKSIYDECGRLCTSFVPEGCTIQAVENELAYWENEWSAPADMVIIDYADLMESARKSYSEQEKLGHIFRDLKRFSQVHKCRLWSATQVALRAYGKKFLTKEDTSYSGKKLHPGNLILGLSADENDKMAGILNLSVIKNSFGVENVEIVLYPDLAKSRIDLGSEDIEEEEDEKRD